MSASALRSLARRAVAVTNNFAPRKVSFVQEEHQNKQSKEDSREKQAPKFDCGYNVGCEIGKNVTIVGGLGLLSYVWRRELCSPRHPPLENSDGAIRGKICVFSTLSWVLKASKDKIYQHVNRVLCGTASILPSRSSSGVGSSIKKAQEGHHTNLQSGVANSKTETAQIKEDGEVARAIYNLAVSFDRGYHGKGPNEKKALQLYLQASQLGHGSACYNAAIMLSRGRGVDSPDLEKAMHLLEKASSYGVKEAQAVTGIETMSLPDHVGNLPTRRVNGPKSVAAKISRPVQTFERDRRRTMSSDSGIRTRSPSNSSASGNEVITQVPIHPMPGTSSSTLISAVR